MHSGRGNPKHEYNMLREDQQEKIQSTDCQKDLGVYIDNKMKFRQRQITLDKANVLKSSKKRMAF